MKFSKLLILSVLFFSPILSLAAQSEVTPPPPPPPPPLPGDGNLPKPGEDPRFPPKNGGFRHKDSPFEDENEPFGLVFIKSHTDEKFRFFDFCFNKVIEPDSIVSAEIYINGNHIDKDSIHYSRDGRKFRVRIDGNYDEEYSIKIKGIISKRGMEMTPVEIDDVPANSVYTYDKERGKWQKFSL